MSAMKSQYGANKGESVFYASLNAGKIKGVHKKGTGGAGASPCKYVKREGNLESRVAALEQCMSEEDGDESEED
jgi:hypothetical protein